MGAGVRRRRIQVSREAHHDGRAAGKRPDRKDTGMSEVEFERSRLTLRQLQLIADQAKAQLDVINRELEAAGTEWNPINTIHPDGGWAITDETIRGRYRAAESECERKCATASDYSFLVHEYRRALDSLEGVGLLGEPVRAEWDNLRGCAAAATAVTEALQRGETVTSDTVRATATAAGLEIRAFRDDE